MNENKTPAIKGVYNCEFVSATRSTKTNHAEHLVLSIRLKPTGSDVPGNVCDYFAELVLAYKIGKEFNFYDRENKCNVRRAATADDCANAIAYARKCFPAWSAYLDSLPEGSTYKTAFKWFDESHDDIIVRAAVKNPREYNGKFYYEATIYESRDGHAAIDDDLDDAFGSSFAAAGLKFGAKPAAPKPGKPAPSKPTAKRPAPIQQPTKTMDDAWNAYEGGDRIKNDPNGAKFYDACSSIVGKPADEESLKSWTGDDWRLCVDAFSLPF